MIGKKILSVLAISFACMNANANQCVTPMQHIEEKQMAHVLADFALARPVGFVATVAGLASYVVTAPFHVLQKDSKAFDVLVKKPAKLTFARCLGCSVKEYELIDLRAEACAAENGAMALNTQSAE